MKIVMFISDAVMLFRVRVVIVTTVINTINNLY